MIAPVCQSGFLTVKAAAERLGVSRPKVNRLLHTGVLVGRHLPGCPARIDPASVERLLAAHSYGQGDDTQPVSAN